MYKLTLLAVVATLVALAYASCPENEQVPPCVPCHESCTGARHPRFCAMICIPPQGKCYCKPNFFRNRFGNCVTEDKCEGFKPMSTTPKPKSVCKNANEVVPVCEPCLQTCEDVKNGLMCTAVCKPTNACFCKSEMVKNRFGDCVPNYQC